MPQFSLQKEAAGGGRRHSGVRSDAGQPGTCSCNLQKGRGLTWATEERTGMSCGSSGGGGRVSWEDGWAAPWVGLSLQLLDSMGRGLCFL